ncbi:hypothetical protein Asp14428_78230 [Actinoplanes sp. NBRC 14428]|nr:hypothetical protein Asp14428_78230 [Actinoplanes sp. NBRC 14428]
MEFKAVGQGGKTASTSLAAGIEWRLQALLAGDALEIQDRVDADRVRVQNQPLKAKNAVVKGGEPFPHQSSSVVPNNPDEIVTVYSDPDPDKKGVEWYEVRKYKKPFAITSPGTLFRTSVTVHCGQRHGCHYG